MVCLNCKGEEAPFFKTRIPVANAKANGGIGIGIEIQLKFIVNLNKSKKEAHRSFYPLTSIGLLKKRDNAYLI
jgi:hypothetical protein